METSRDTYALLFYPKKTTGKKVTIVGRITVNGEPKCFSPKCKVLEDDWQQDKQKVRGNSEEAKRINKILNYFKEQGQKTYDSLFVKNSGKVTALMVYNYLFGKVTTPKNNLIEFFNQYIDDVIKVRENLGEIKESTRMRYERTRDRLLDFLKIKLNVSDILMDDIYPIHILTFHLFLQENYKGCHNNGANKYMQLYKKIITVASGNGLLTHDPFVGFSYKWDKYHRGYLIEDEIIPLMQKEFSIERLEKVRDFYLFQCFSGLAYKDLKGLKKTDIGKLFDGDIWIKEARSKTDVEARVLLLDIPKFIIEKYAKEMKDSEYVLPIVSNQKMNAYLKEIADLCGITKNLTTHLARHTFATMTLNKGVPIETVSKMLGHTNINTTQIYAKILAEKVSQDLHILKPKLEGIESKFLSKPA